MAQTKALKKSFRPVIVICQRINAFMRNNTAVVHWNYRTMLPGPPGQFRFTVKFTFTVGNDGYAWVWNECSKDALTKDGIGLPGTHSCGANKVAASTLYLG